MLVLEGLERVLHVSKPFEQSETTWWKVKSLHSISSLRMQTRAHDVTSDEIPRSFLFVKCLAAVLRCVSTAESHRCLKGGCTA